MIWPNVTGIPHHHPPLPPKNLGVPHTLTPKISNPTPTLCTNAPPNHHAHLGYSHLPTSDGHNMHHLHNGHSLVTLLPHPLQASIIYNSLDLAYLRHEAHYYVMRPVGSNFIPQPPHLTSTPTSLWKIHTPPVFVKNTTVCTTVYFTYSTYQKGISK